MAFLRVFFFFFPLELKHGKPNPTPPEDLQTDVAFPAHPQLLSPSQPLVAYKEQLIPSKGRKPVSLLHAVITSQRVFKLFVFSIASFNLALASKCKIAKQLLAFHVVKHCWGVKPQAGLVLVITLLSQEKLDKGGAEMLW